MFNNKKILIAGICAVAIIGIVLAVMIIGRKQAQPPVSPQDGTSQTDGNNNPSTADPDESKAPDPNSSNPATQSTDPTAVPSEVIGTVGPSMDPEDTIPNDPDVGMQESAEAGATDAPEN